MNVMNKEQAALVGLARYMKAHGIQFEGGLVDGLSTVDMYLGSKVILEDHQVIDHNLVTKTIKLREV